MWTGEHRFGDQAQNQDIALLSTTPGVASRIAINSIALIDRYSFTREAILGSLHNLCRGLKTQPFATCDEYLKSYTPCDVILYHAHQATVHNGNDAETLSLKGLVSIAPVIILSDADSLESICAAFDMGVRGYIPVISTNLELAIEIMYLVKAGGTFLPPSCLASPRRAQPPGIPRPAATQFTTRQMAVLERLKLGKTNKSIAYELAMSESSVKTHICNIMKKMNATNRTEVVCRAHELVKLTAAD